MRFAINLSVLKIISLGTLGVLIGVLASSLVIRPGSTAPDYASRAYSFYVSGYSAGNNSSLSTSPFAYPYPGGGNGYSGSGYVSGGNGSSQTTSSVSNQTSNWAGYVSSGGTYTTISGDWTVPTVSASDESTAADATWIGIGGDSSEDLIQIGTQNVVEDGQVQVGSFYEQLPDASNNISTVNVNPGDNISASIKEVGADEWTVTIKDLTNGESYSNTVNYDSSESSAEWIEEAPSDGESIIPLDQFGTVSFSAGSTTDNGQLESIYDSGAQAVNMVNNQDQALTNVSSLTSNGQGFSVTRTDASAEEDYSAGFDETIPSAFSRHEFGMVGGSGRGSIGGYGLNYEF